MPVMAQTGAVNGFVRDATNGEALVGCNVIILGTAFGSATDDSGYYSIERVPVGKHVLAVSHLGYADDRLLLDVSGDTARRVDVELLPSLIDVPGVLSVAGKPHIDRTPMKPSRILPVFGVAVVRRKGLLGLLRPRRYVDGVAYLSGTYSSITPTYTLGLSPAPERVHSDAHDLGLRVVSNRDTWDFLGPAGSSADAIATTLVEGLRPGDTLRLCSRQPGDRISGVTVMPGDFQILTPSRGDTVTGVVRLSWTRSPGAAGYALKIRTRSSDVEGKCGPDRLVSQPRDRETLTVTVRMPEDAQYDWAIVSLSALDANLLRWLRARSRRCCLFGGCERAGLTGADGVFGACVMQSVRVWVEP